MAHGTPSSMDEMPEYLRLVRGGRAPSEELVQEMRHNYGAIGGRSPLTDLTLAQAAALRARLGDDIPVAVGMRNGTPFVKDAIGDLAAQGVSRIVGIPLAPQFSTLSIAKYFDAADAALPPGLTLEKFSAAPAPALPLGLPPERAGAYHNHPLLTAALAGPPREAQPQPDEE